MTFYVHIPMIPFFSVILSNLTLPISLCLYITRGIRANPPSSEAKQCQELRYVLQLFAIFSQSKDAYLFKHISIGFLGSKDLAKQLLSLAR